MRITIFNLNTNKSVIEIKFELSKRMFIVQPVIIDKELSFLTNDLLNIRTKWMTHYLNFTVYDKDNNENKLEESMLNDILIIIKKAMIYLNEKDGTYKVFFYKV